ncbi:D-alanyl-D-alanine carboxypeptidase family protein [Marinococcus luteus]|uniref:D-alanyl-D-alanine carboxypeptidase family protein n=1 Tax=Marinococcus luteus TaxID=1122204 RepID=UPI002ACCE232|nr:D-alanyl-D-alanine carboxypeptidase family protein [Marinococcus luteus]MDZ5782501.1 D-alanyl-D-alanine carboxypeptidase family protein [Marinococcus luteus]
MKRNKLKTAGVACVAAAAIWTFGSVPAQAAEPDIEASASIMIDADTGQVVFEDNTDELLSAASMSKMMTEYIVNKAVEDGDISWNDEVAISDKVRELSLQTNLSNVPLRQDETYTVEELYEAMAIYSANGATIALAEHIEGSEAAFADRMNQQAGELGMENYEFVNATGLNNSMMMDHAPEGSEENAENMMSANDTALLAYHLLDEYPEVLDVAGIPKKTFKEGTEEPTDMINWNKMLPGLEQEYEGVDGLKTGTTDLAGNAFTGTIEQDGNRYISVVMNAETKMSRFTETAKLYDYAERELESRTLVEKGAEIDGESSIEVEGGQEESIDVTAGEKLELISSEEIEPEYEIAVSKSEAPIEKGEEVGTVVVANSEASYVQGGASRTEVPLTADEAVEERGWFGNIVQSVSNLFISVWHAAAGK